MLILGSESKARKQLLEQIGLKPHKILAANIDETSFKKESPRKYAERMALKKATILSGDYNDCLLTADTVVSVGTTILHKTKDKDVAKAYLNMLSGRRHKVFTAVCIKYKNNITKFYEKTAIKARVLSKDEIDQYLLTNEWKNKAGAYSIQGKAICFFLYIKGCYTNVIGLPGAKIINKLKGIGYKF